MHDVTKWPSIDFGDVYSYLIETTGPFTKEKLKAYILGEHSKREKYHSSRMHNIIIPVINELSEVK